MFKRLLAVGLALMVLAGCGTKNRQPNDLPSEAAGVEFQFKELSEYAYTMALETSTFSNQKTMFGINIPDAYDCDFVSETELEDNYILYSSDNSEGSAAIKVTTGPNSLAEYFGSEDPKELEDLIKPVLFPTEDVHAGLVRAVVEDFGYQLVNNWTGTAFGMNAFFVEFIDEESKNHALRFFLCNDKLDENYYSLTINADLPMDDKSKIEDYKAIIFSLKMMNEGIVADPQPAESSEAGS